MHGCHNRAVKGFAVCQGQVHIVHHEASGDGKEQTLYKGRYHQRNGDLYDGLGIGTSVDPCRLQHIGGYAHETCHIDQHHVSCVLPHGHDDQTEHGAVCGGQPGGGQGADGKGIAQSHERAVKHKFPDVTKHDAADEVGNEKTCPEEVLTFDAAGHKECQYKGHYVHQNHGDGGVDDSPAQGLPIGSVPKGR